MVPLVRHVIALALTLSLQSSFSQITYQVTNTNDSGPGSLRRAVLDANATAGRDNIVFDPSLSNSTIVLTSGHLRVT